MLINSFIGRNLLSLLFVCATLKIKIFLLLNNIALHQLKQSFYL
jgi:hypothetical protein